MMALKCSNPQALRAMIMAELNPFASSPIDGKTAFKIGDVVCNVYENKTVYFQGVTTTQDSYVTVQRITDMVNTINSGY